MQAARREFLKSSGALTVAAAGSGCASLMPREPADVLIVNGRVATLDPRRPNAEAIAWSTECPCGAF